MENPRVSMVVAVGTNRVIGKKNGLLWNIPDDLKHFRSLTLGHPVVMGRKTFDSIKAMLGKPLPGRTNIVVTRDPSWNFENVFVANSIEDALKKAAELDHEEIFVIGGAQIYEQALRHTDRLYLTLVDDAQEGDAYFPPYEQEFTKKLSQEPREVNGLKYRWVTLER